VLLQKPWLIFLETGWAWYPLKHQVLIHHDQELTMKLTKTTGTASAWFPYAAFTLHLQQFQNT
jgi:hypothetical protein